MRQSARNRVKKRLATACLDQPASAFPAAWLWAARIRNPVLLKTASRNPASSGASRRVSKVSIDGAQGLMQREGPHWTRPNVAPAGAAQVTEPDPALPPT